MSEERMRQAENALASVWQQLNDAFNIMENLRPAGGFKGNFFPRPSPPDPVMGFYNCSKHGEVIPRVQCTECSPKPDPVSVSKKDIVGVINAHCRRKGVSWMDSDYPLADDLLALLSGQGSKRKPEWCEHMEKGWMKENPWKFCPYCSASRPT